MNLCRRWRSKAMASCEIALGTIGSESIRESAIRAGAKINLAAAKLKSNPFHSAQKIIEQGHSWERQDTHAINLVELQRTLEMSSRVMSAISELILVNGGR